jgi:hypothetical protein
MKCVLIIGLFAVASLLGIVSESEARCRGGRSGGRIFHRHHAGGAASSCAGWQR